jgi:hypothetical protein
LSMYAHEMRKAVSRSTDGELLVKALREQRVQAALPAYRRCAKRRTGSSRGLSSLASAWRGRKCGRGVHAARRTKRLGPAAGDWVKDAVFRQYQEWVARRTVRAARLPQAHDFLRAALVNEVGVSWSLGALSTSARFNAGMPNSFLLFNSVNYSKESLGLRISVPGPTT